MILLKLVGWFSRFPGAWIKINVFPVIWNFIWYLIILSPLYLKFRHKRLLLTAGTVVIFLMIGGVVLYLPAEEGPPFQAVFFNTESGEPTLLRKKGGPVILISSDDDPFDDIVTIIFPYLFQEKIGHIDYLVLTEANLNHLNVINKLLEFVEIGTVLDHPLGPLSPSSRRFRAVLDKNDINYRRLTHDDLVEAEGIRISVLWPRCVRGTNFQADYSLVVRIQFGDIIFLFPSRIGVKVQEELAKRPVDLKATILKIPGCGSCANVSPFFLKAVNPEYWLLIQGRKYFGRYPRDCGDFLQANRVEVHKTGDEGCITVETDGVSCRVISTRNSISDR